MPWEWHEPLFALGRELGIAVFSSPFDHTAVDMLEQLGAPAYKIASLELCDIPLIQYVARTGKPMIMSTGASELGEIADAVAAARGAGCKELILLKCTSGYPTPPAESYLKTIPHLTEMFDCVVGLSDHTMGTAVPVAATALGSALVEKHFTLARADGGVDSAFSLEPAELKQMIEAINVAWEAVGSVHYGPSASEAGIRPLRRSLYVVKDVKAGDIIGAEHVRSIRPGKGLAPKHLPDVLGRRAARDLKRGTAVDWTMLATTN
jgi:N-acetylneuraminate synthase